MRWVPVEKVGGPGNEGGRAERTTLTKQHSKEGGGIRPCGHLRVVPLSVAQLEDDPFLLQFLKSSTSNFWTTC